MNFEPFPKIGRLFRDVIVTEKIDGTNAQISITPLDDQEEGPPAGALDLFLPDGTRAAIRAGSRNRWITPDSDNFGFAKWVWANASDLMSLGIGQHFGEWWGQGIQRGYGLTEKRFSLFNTHRWGEVRPACCHVVPVLFQGPFNTALIEGIADGLREGGSRAAPGFANPEGIVVYHTANQSLFKYTLGGDGAKGPRG